MKRPPSTSNNTSSSSSMPRLIRIIRLGLVAFGIGMMSGTFRKVTKMDLQSYTNTNAGSISSQSDQLLSEDDKNSGSMEVSGETNRALTTTKTAQQQTQSSDTDTTAVSSSLVAPLEPEEEKASESEAAVEPDEKTLDTAEDSTPEETNKAEEIPKKTNQILAKDSTTAEEAAETEGTETEETRVDESLEEETAEAEAEETTPGTEGNTTDAAADGTTTTETGETTTTEETAESEADEQNDDSESDPAGGTGEESDIIPGNTTLEEIVGDMEDTPTYEAEADQTEGTSEEGADQPKPSKNETETESQGDQPQDTESEGGEQEDTTAKDRPAEAESDQGGDQDKPISTSEEATKPVLDSAPATTTTHTTTLSKPASNHTITAPSSMTTRPVGMGACLLIKDDNHWVIEWLAFHWFVIPLRYLVVVIDPSSVTSPLQILDRWKDLMEIEIWHDKDFINEQKITKQTRDIYKQNTQLMKHRHRQATFYNKFLRHVHRHKKLMKIPWVFLTDTDEFLSLNYPYLSGEQTSSFKFPTTPELQDMARQFPITERGSVLRFLAHHQSVTKKTEKCLYVQRYQVGSQQANASLVERYLPYDNTTSSQSQQLLNPHNMLTQNFLYRTPKHIKFGKNVLHLTAIDRIAKEPSNVHKVSSRHCVGVAGADGLASTSYLKINHYVGTPEQYLFRQDPRSRTNIHGGQANRPQKGIKENKGDQRNLERFNLLNVGTTHFSSDMQGWVQGFIQEVGLAKAQELLAGVGELGVE
ncbi:expressed unknown protein [Seminavis robusta]|uniref:Glycosyltransferase family 92 protein n=1 Tax=Seminavis robusta TaxID=568900 RepID=A0A9N8E761_9STRA|nr:expressed unknown protein [Seminavis robusta]|eukprot:Sro694_g188440.1 n/a (759) ;mRNA; f:9110-11386